MKPILLTEEIIEKGTYIIKISHYDNDDLIVSVLDFETLEELAYIDIVDDSTLGFNIGLN
jgi:hypothetical protein